MSGILNPANTFYRRLVDAWKKAGEVKRINPAV